MFLVYAFLKSLFESFFVNSDIFVNVKVNVSGKLCVVDGIFWKQEFQSLGGLKLFGKLQLCSYS